MRRDAQRARRQRKCLVLGTPGKFMGWASFASGCSDSGVHRSPGQFPIRAATGAIASLHNLDFQAVTDDGFSLADEVPGGRFRCKPPQPMLPAPGISADHCRLRRAGSQRLSPAIGAFRLDRRRWRFAPDRNERRGQCINTGNKQDQQKLAAVHGSFSTRWNAGFLIAAPERANALVGSKAKPDVKQKATR